jgi:16S rRNA (cytidine1402-2'-O)-methyltransferase
MVEALGEGRELVIARELTKRFESIHRCRLADASGWLAADADRVRGEFVLIVEAPARAERAADDAARTHVLSVLLAELPLAQAVRLAVALTGAPRKALYARALELSGRSKA